MAINDDIIELRNDRSSGAREIVKKAADILSKSQNPDLIEAVRKTHPDMAPLHKLCELISQTQSSTEKIADFLNDIDKAPIKIAGKLAVLLAKRLTIMTYSRSSTVKECILELQQLGKEIHMLVPESTPGSEGRKLSGELGDAGIRTLLITDAAAHSKIQSADCLMVGADRITPPIFVNKIGTLDLVMLAKEYGIPAYLLADQSKYVENWPNPIKNPYFEKIPLNLVTVVPGV